MVSDFFEFIHILPKERSSREVRQLLWKKKEIPIPILSKVSILKFAYILLKLMWKYSWLRYSEPTWTIFNNHNIVTGP